MKILVVGDFEFSDSSNYFIVKAFENLGSEVITFDPRATKKEIGIESTNAGLVYEVYNEKPDLVFFNKGESVLADTVSKISSLALTWYWFDNFIIKGIDKFVELASNCTFISATGKGIAQFFKKEGNLKNVYHIVGGVDTEYYKTGSFNKDFKADMSFIGTRTLERMDILYKVGAHGILKVYGPGFGNYMLRDSFNSVCASSKIMLNISAQNNLEDYFDESVFKYLATKSLVFQKYTPGVEKFFENGKHLIWFYDHEDLIHLTKIYLSGARDSEIKEIGEEGYKHILKNFTWEKPAKYILEMVEKNG